MNRSILLPEFLQTEAWLQYAQAIDEFMAGTDNQTRLLSRLREPLHLTFRSQRNVINKEMINEPDLGHFDREFMIRSLNLVGMPFSNTSVLSDEQLFRLLQTLPRFWYSKGKQDVARFLSYVLGSNLRITRMWTEDYVNFLPEGDPGIGVPIYVEGGTWYPTTHVDVSFDPLTMGSVTVQSVIDMLSEIGNYNLVFYSVSASSEIPAVQNSDKVSSPAEFVSSRSVGLGMVVVNEIQISN